ncbi:hypothetical protein HMF8227_01435 [Saliniradius amylolyticus]|uniref:Uncharacterized protein n=1 Tax=Saliniradius amylolyticus TaxID=2183582 RepID=A0A2S2E3T0_9ALTE|nr:hypothetical protein [Saliniradius amylolyticus]AWL11910.1 hypothetical protein HMF8227_01435 [Saliniradius amylolyticus]
MDREFNQQFFSYFGYDKKSAAKFFGCTVRTLDNWLTGKPCCRAKKLLSIAYRGYLPETGPWKRCKINKEGNVETPWGICRPSDLAFVHRYKAIARLQAKVMNNQRNQQRKAPGPRSAAVNEVKSDKA